MDPVGWHMIGAVALLGAVTQSTLLAACFGSRPAAFLGRISFLVYLLHIPVICSLTSWMLLRLQGLPYAANATISALVTTAAVIILAAISWRPADHLPTRLSKAVGDAVDTRVRRLLARLPWPRRREPLIPR
jgi:peptidoglycan/LPS O-acetylase OafA/YrhL